MQTLPRIVANPLFLGIFCAAFAYAEPAATVRQVKVLGSRDAVEIEIDSSSSITPQTQILTGPDRLVIDFPNAVPGALLRSQSVNRGEVKDVRFGLFQSNPPVTRIVLDLKSAQSFQVFPNGHALLIKVTGNTPDLSAGVQSFSSQPQPATLLKANYTASGPSLLPAQPKLDVTFREGQLTIRSNKATLSEILFAVQQRTNAEIAIPAGAEQERVVANLGPAPAQEVLSRLLNGTHFNFLILNSPKDPRQLDRLILTPRNEAMVLAAANPQPTPDDNTNDEPTPVPPTPVQVAPVQNVGPQNPPPPGQVAPAPGFPGGVRPQPETTQPSEEDTPD